MSNDRITTYTCIEKQIHSSHKFLIGNDDPQQLAHDQK